jgi:integrase
MAQFSVKIISLTGSVLGENQQIDGKPDLAFVQEKTGFQDRTKVVVPLVDSLARAIDATTTGDQTFLVTDYGKPFSKNGLGNRFRSWCREAGLPDDLSSHGIRKAVGAILAEAGCTQYEIMALHGHGDPKASEIYTRSVDRRKLVESAMGRIDLGTIIG